MCGRYTRKSRRNIAPSQAIEALRLGPGGQQELFEPTWGLVPSWSTSLAGGIINARAETVATKPLFRAAFKARRCIISADGFYEWKRTDAGKVPHFICLSTGEPMAFAGVWEPSRAEGQPTAAIITTSANALMAPIHDRMPAIIEPDAVDTWLSPATSPADLLALLRPLDAAKLQAWPVSARVNSPKVDDAHLTDRVAPAEPDQGSLFPS